MSDLPILVCLHNCLVDNLLQLLIFEIVAHHHFEDEKELSIRDHAVAIHIINLEGDCRIDALDCVFMLVLSRQTHI